MKPKSSHISFIIPAYNCADTIEEAVDSIASGNIERGDEVIIVDDGSTDSTRTVLQRLLRKYDFIRLIRHTTNRGGGAARNTAVENARNELLFCLDSDNVLEINTIPKLKQFIQDNEADAAALRELWYFSERKDLVTHKWVFREGQTTLADYLSGHVVAGASGNYMFTKQSWARAGGYPEFAGALDAWGFGFRQVATGQKMMVMPVGGYYHRHGHASYWVRESKKGQTSLTALQIVIPFLSLIVDRDVNYMMGARSRYTWFDHLDKRPVRIKGAPQGYSGCVLDSRVTPESRYGAALQRIGFRMFR
ncbi:MAG: glycosyltransferase [Nitrospira sp.]|nr:glycosyltransferase [Nitrospira sp.]